LDMDYKDTRVYYLCIYKLCAATKLLIHTCELQGNELCSLHKIYNKYRWSSFFLKLAYEVN